MPSGAYLIGAGANDASRNTYLADEELRAFGIYYGSIHYRQAVAFVARKDHPESLVFKKAYRYKGPVMFITWLSLDSGNNITNN